MQRPESPSQSAIFDILKDCVAYQVIQSSKEQLKEGKGVAKSSKRWKRSDAEAENEDEDLAVELDEFALYLTQEIYQLLPANLVLNNGVVNSTTTSPEDSSIESRIDTLAVPPTFAETLTTYSLANTPDAASELFHSILAAFITEYRSQQALGASEVVEEGVPPPGGWKSTRTTECEICTRNVPLTYHHLVPRSTHQKVLKRKWHPEARLNSVAWLCRPCHSAVHKTASNEDLAREYYTVELLLQVESLQRWAAYASRQRWGVRRG